MPQHHQYQYSNQEPLSIPVEATVFSSLVLVLLLGLLLVNYYFGSSFILHPLHSLEGLMEVLKWKISQLGLGLGEEDRPEVDWSSSQDELMSKHSGSTGIMRRSHHDLPSDAIQGRYYPGLLNAAGNLCFLNSTLQAMASTPKLLLFLEALTASSASNNTPVASSLLDLLSALNTPSHRRTSPLRPIELANALAASSDLRRELLSSSEQQDAHELWGMIISAVDDELVLNQKAQKRNERLRNPYLHLLAQSVQCLVCGYTRDIRLVSELLTTMVLPGLRSCSLEQCLEEYTRMDPISEYSCRKCAMVATFDRLSAQRDRLAAITFSPAATPALSNEDPTMINLDAVSASAAPLASSSMPTTASKSKKNRLRDVKKLVEKARSAIEASDFERELGDNVRVEKVYGPAGKSIRFARTPDILAFHFNRSTQFSRNGTPYKNTCQVIFPEILDTSPYSSATGLTPSAPSSHGGDDMPASTDLYRLASLVVHYGSHHFGHYVTYRRRPAPLVSSSVHFDSPPFAGASDSPSPLEDVEADLTPVLDRSSSSSDVDGTSSILDSSELLPILPRRIEWYRASDETVDPTNLEEVLRANPFLIFYERIGAVEDEIEVKKESITARVVQRWNLSGTGSNRAGLGIIP